MSKPKRGLAAMPLKKRKAIAKMGGKAAQASEALHKLTKDDQSAGGKKGGSVVASKEGWMSELAKKPRKKKRKVA